MVVFDRLIVGFLGFLADMEHELANLSFDDEEKEGLVVPTEVGSQSVVSEFSIFSC